MGANPVIGCMSQTLPQTADPAPAPPAVRTARQATILYAPGFNAEGLSTGDGTLRSYTSPVLTNLSGKTMAEVSIVLQG